MTRKTILGQHYQIGNLEIKHLSKIETKVVILVFSENVADWYFDLAPTESLLANIKNGVI